MQVVDCCITTPCLFYSFACTYNYVFADGALGHEALIFLQQLADGLSGS